MAYADLREFVRKLESEGELRRVKAEVDPVLEIAEVVQRLRREALRGENVATKKSSDNAEAGATHAGPIPAGLGPALLLKSRRVRGIRC